MNSDGTPRNRGAEDRKYRGPCDSAQWSKDGTAVYFPNCWKVDFSFDCQIYAVKLDQQY